MKPKTKAGHCSGRLQARPEKTNPIPVHSGPSRQQLALAAFVRDYPEQAQLFARQVPDVLTVEEIKIEPITITELDQ